MARLFQVLLGNIGDLPQPPGAPGWTVNFPSIINPATAAQIANSLNNGGIAQTAVGTHFANFVDLWVLTGGNPEDGTYSFNNLPAGFTVATQLLQAGVAVVGGPGAYTAELTALGSGSSNTLNDTGTLTFTYNALQTAFQLGTEKLGIDCTPNAGIISITFLQLTGTYTLLPFQWTIDTPNPVRNNEPFQVSSPIVDGLLLNHLDEVDIQYTNLDGDPVTIEITDFVILNAHLMIFLFPDLPGVDANELISLNAIGDGTQFSGSVMLGILEILIENGSGIYRIVSGKTNDTLYVNSAVDDTTADVKIPNPFAKTGYVGG